VEKDNELRKNLGLKALEPRAWLLLNEPFDLIGF
jgi:hypothetical protein